MTPFIRKITKLLNKSLILWYFAGWIFYQSFLQLSNITHSHIPIVIDIFSGYLGFYLFGHYSKNLRFTRRQLLVLGLVAILSVIALMLQIYLWTGNKVTGTIFYPNILFVSTISLGFSAYLVLREAGKSKFWKKHFRLSRIINAMGECSFGIYLVHPAIMEELYLRFHAGLWSINPAIYLPIAGLLLFLVSFVVVYLLRRIPIVRLIVP